MLRSRKPVLALVGVLSLVLVLLVSCGTIPMSGALVMVKPVTVMEGGTVTVTGTAFKPNENVKIIIDASSISQKIRKEIGKATADDKGNFVVDGLVISVTAVPQATIFGEGDQGSKGQAILEITAKK